jgi:hypothetical protein
VRFQVLKVVTCMKITALWDFMPSCLIEVDQHFRGETSGNFYETTQCNITDAWYGDDRSKHLCNVVNCNKITWRNTPEGCHLHTVMMTNGCYWPAGSEATGQYASCVDVAVTLLSMHTACDTKGNHVDVLLHCPQSERTLGLAVLVSLEHLPDVTVTTNQP